MNDEPKETKLRTKGGTKHLNPNHTKLYRILLIREPPIKEEHCGSSGCKNLIEYLVQKVPNREQGLGKNLKDEEEGGRGRSKGRRGREREGAE